MKNKSNVKGRAGDKLGNNTDGAAAPGLAGVALLMAICPSLQECYKLGPEPAINVNVQDNRCVSPRCFSLRPWRIWDQRFVWPSYRQ